MGLHLENEVTRQIELLKPPKIILNNPVKNYIGKIG
jgi:hypothetical protein